MDRIERISYGILVAVVAFIPFDLLSFPIMSNLQWLFAGVAVTAFPVMWQHRRQLLTNRLAVAAAVFVATQWIAAALAEEFKINAFKGAIRVTAGWILLCATLCVRGRVALPDVWRITAVIAALYALIDFYGFGLPSFFRKQEFVVDGIQRLSGSFEYPNTAGAFFALSLPVVITVKSGWNRLAALSLVGTALLLTYSRGAIIAVSIAMLIWALAAKSRPVLVSSGVFALVVLSGMVLWPSLLLRFTPRSPMPLDAEYDADFNQMKHRPQSTGEFVIRVKNVGGETWLPDGERPVTLSYRWYDRENRTRVRPKTILTPLNDLVRPQQSATIRALFNTPQQPGRYLLIWDMNRPGIGWFGANGIMPWVVEVDIQGGAEPSFGRGDVSQWYDRAGGWFLSNQVVGRLDLWRTAWELGMSRPFFGAGPDSFRLLYSSHLGVDPPDTNIRSNNLYLELFFGSGFLGLAGFLLMVSAVPRSPEWPSIALAVFLIHGLVDVFLMTTPIYFAFWVLLGLSSRGVRIGNDLYVRVLDAAGEQKRYNDGLTHVKKRSRLFAV